MTDVGLPRAECPEQVGMSAPRLAHIGAVLRADVERGSIPGAVMIVARHGRVAFAEACGFRDRAAGAPMPLDAIFRIASMSKPITSVAAMMLAEEGRLQISAPVAEYLPEFKDRTVGIERRPAARVMTVQDLLRHTSGLTYAPFGETPVQMLWRDHDLMSPEQSNAELVTKLAALPLMFEPGTTWEYSMSTDVLGRVVEVVSGEGLAEFVAKRIARPLRLGDTGFAPQGAPAARVAEAQVDPATGMRAPMRDLSRPARWASGGGGMVGTAADYLRFCQMLLNGGELEGMRLLSPSTVALMASDHLPPGCAHGPTARDRFGPHAPVPEMGHGFGLGFAVRTAPGRSPLPGSVGDYFWGGVYGTNFWIDPAEQLIAVLMTQAPERRLHYRAASRALVYAAITG
jgi:CubicO group peptidase (beta-lactamase class C family)